jgi:26S proteasome regulatory subunit N5
MSAGVLKPEKDFTKDADKLIPEAEALAKVRLTDLINGCTINTNFAPNQTDVQGAIDKLLVLEKQARQVRCPVIAHPPNSSQADRGRVKQ